VPISRSDQYVVAGLAALRRVSSALRTSDTRRYFRPLGLPYDIDLNEIGAKLFDILAAEIERRDAQRTRGSRTKR
jgi:hypothetical protein